MGELGVVLIFGGLFVGGLTGVFTLITKIPGGTQLLDAIIRMMEE